MTPPLDATNCDLFLSVNADTLAISDGLEAHEAVGQSEERIVRSASDIDTGMNLGPALSDKDITGDNRLPICSLDAETLRLAVPSVLRGADALFMSKEL